MWYIYEINRNGTATKLLASFAGLSTIQAQCIWGYTFFIMHCIFCKSDNIQLFKEGEFTTGVFCNDCGQGRVDYTHGTCCGNQHLINIRFEQANKTIVQREACKNCKTMIGGAKKKDADFNSYRLFTQERFLQIQEQKNTEHTKLQNYLTELRDIFRQDKSEQRREFYEKYLQSNKWKQIRAKVLERENGLCQGCGYAKAVHVHHTTYENLGDELLFQLIALCVQCHSKLHPEKDLSC